MFKRLLVACLSATLLPLAAMAPAQAYTPKTLKVGFVPSENMAEIMKSAQPIVDLLKRNLKMDVQSFVATDYTGVVEALRAGRLDVAFLNPAAYVLAKSEANVTVILKSHRNGHPTYYSAIFTRTDSGIKTLKDLKGRTFAFGDPLSTSGHIFARQMLKAQGLNPDRDFKQSLFAGSHDATVLSVLNKKADAGATFSNDTTGHDAAWNQFLKSPAEQKQIRALAFSVPIPADNIVVKTDLDKAVQQKITKVFVDLEKSPGGKKLMRDLYRIDGFKPATDRDYDLVRKAFADAGIKLKDSLRKK